MVLLLRLNVEQRAENFQAQCKREARRKMYTQALDVHQVAAGLENVLSRTAMQNTRQLLNIFSIYVIATCLFGYRLKAR